MGVERPSFHRSGCIQTSSGQGGLGGSAPLAAVPVGAKALSPSENQGVCLAPSTIAPDNEVPAAAHGPGLPNRVSAVRTGSGGLLAPVLRLPPGPGSMVSNGRRPPHGDLGGGVLAISWRRNTSLRS